MIVMIQALHKVSKTNFSKALGCSFKKVTRLLVPLYMSVTLRNAIISTHVDTSRTRTVVSTWPTGNTRRCTLD